MVKSVVHRKQWLIPVQNTIKDRTRFFAFCMADMVDKMIRAGEVDSKLLVVIFIDEEAINDGIDRKVIGEWRKKFMLAGAAFDWWCIEVKHFSAYNQLTSDECPHQPGLYCLSL